MSGEALGYGGPSHRSSSRGMPLEGYRTYR
ncbi:uncharacterized protein G2W53_026792 [Senna tora]|uniref:Uncharacterized protein n=1 Tax=Senna tora TaxID=362788 RepID=A0A834TFP8_9FABA|nr:uncharacterized protein G2W53_026792 [Senna tora]